MRQWKAVVALTKMRPSISQVRYWPHSLPWHSGAAAADTQTSSLEETRRDTSNTQQARPMSELDGQAGWPLVGNFLTYLKKENLGQMHVVQVRNYSYRNEFYNRCVFIYHNYRPICTIASHSVSGSGKIPLNSSVSFCISRFPIRSRSVVFTESFLPLS